MKSFFRFIFYLPFTIFFRVQCFLAGGITIGSNLEVCGFIFLRNKGIIEIGNNVRINSCRACNPAAGGITSIQVLKNAKLKIGNRVGISNCALTCAEHIQIGNDVNVGADTIISDTDFHSLNADERIGRRFGQTKEIVKTKPIKIGNKCFLGMRVVVLKGTDIGERSVIGASSLVTSKIESDSVAVGIPCKVVRSL
ncbi:acyltransferase [Amylibacter sp.]|nr:acyltransferase [Amylibacter sp.]